jgi:hypothetical protein
MEGMEGMGYLADLCVRGPFRTGQINQEQFAAFLLAPPQGNLEKCVGTGGGPSEEGKYN